MSEELAYSLHLGSDKNRKVSSQEIAENNTSRTTSYSNNAIQNATQLSKANNHNLRNYDNQKENIEIIFGTDNLVNDVENLYLQEFEEARLEYNKKQVRDDRKILNYFNNVSKDKKKDLACELVIELGNMEFWNSKTMNYKKKMTDVYKGQVYTLMELVPEFKVANAVIHYDEISPHMHIIGVPVKEGYKTGMKKQVCKSKIFTKESLTKLQEKMRIDCIERFNKVYEQKAILKPKQRGRNLDFNVKDMKNYKYFKKQKDKNVQRLDDANKKNESLSNETEQINKILEDLKPVPFNKNNKQISNEDVEILKNYTENVKDVIGNIKNVNDLNIIMEDFEKSYEKIKMENKQLISENAEKERIINELKEDIDIKDKVIIDLKATLSKVKEELNKFKNFWKRLLTRFQIKIFDEKIGNLETDKRNFTIVAEDLENQGIFDSDDAKMVKDNSHRIEFKENKEVGKRKNLENNKRNNLS